MTGDIQTGGQEPSQHGQTAQVMPLVDWLTAAKLCIPDYQRPYRWSAAQVQQLLRDISHYARMTGQAGHARSYRMGTVVVHAEAHKWNIVDGQQRTVTLLLILHALRELLPDAAALHELALADLQLPHADSHERARENYQLILRHIKQAQWTQAQLEFLLHRCEVVCVSLYDLSEAFQFFDAQNSRGKALGVHDLLKAYHLRAVLPHQNAQRKAAVDVWEQCSPAELERLFAIFLFVTRQYGRGKPAEHFGSESVAVFKGLDMQQSPWNAMPVAKPWQMLDQSFGGMNAAAQGKWPCQLDAPIVNGLRFFEWVQHYERLGFHLQKTSADGLPVWLARVQAVFPCKQGLPEAAQEILKKLGTYKGRHRVGDARIRNLFDALLLYYVDKFGSYELGQAVQVAFVWSYARLMHSRVRAGSVDKMLREAAVNPFAVLRDATDPQEFLEMPLKPAFYEAKNPLSGLDDLKQLFVDVGYWKDK